MPCGRSVVAQCGGAPLRGIERGADIRYVGAGDGTMAATVSSMVQCDGDLAYLGIVAALTRMAISGIARIAHAQNRSFEEELDGYLSVLDQQADNDASDVRAEPRAGHRGLAE